MLQGIVNLESYPSLPHLNFQTSERKRKSVEISHESSWQHQALHEGLQLHLKALQQIARESLPLKMVNELQELQAITAIEYGRNNKLRKRLRKFLKSLGLLETVVSEKAAYIPDTPGDDDPLSHQCETKATDISIWDRENYSFRLSADQLTFLNEFGQVIMEGHSIPDVFRSGQNNTGLISNTLWVNAPIQEIPGDFRMRIPGKNDEDRGRHCETKIEILHYGTYQGKPVTKVLLSPVSGRRHQLRLHCLALGHPIGSFFNKQIKVMTVVGDATYGSLPDDDRSQRMMLHAQRLSIR